MLGGSSFLAALGVLGQVSRVGVIRSGRWKTKRLTLQGNAVGAQGVSSIGKAHAKPCANRGAKAALVRFGHPNFER